MVKFRKKVLSSFLQKNDFEKNDVAGVLDDASQTTLGTGVTVRDKQIPDGDECGNFVILIQYKKKRTVQQFTYKQAIQSNAGRVVGEISLPIVSEESFDAPLNDGFGIDGQDGTPLSTALHDETKATFYVAGKVSTCFCYKDKVDQYPSVVDESADTKAPLSLNICPFVVNESPITGLGTATDSSGYNLYCRSVDHVENP